MVDRIQRKNFLVSEGRSLAAGRHGQLTPAEWLYLYDEVEDELVGRQADIFAGFEERIRNRHQKLVMDTVAL